MGSIPENTHSSLGIITLIFSFFWSMVFGVYYMALSLRFLKVGFSGRCRADGSGKGGSGSC